MIFRKALIVLFWTPGLIVAFPLRLLYQGIVIGVKAADKFLEDTE